METHAEKKERRTSNGKKKINTTLHAKNKGPKSPRATEKRENITRQKLQTDREERETERARARE